MRIKIVSFATVGPYDREADKLRESCKRLGLDLNVVVFSRDYLPTWIDAVKFKPTFIAEQLSLWDNYDGILWTDADSEFVSAPDWTVFDGCHAAWHRFKRSKHHEPENLTGTMFFAQSVLTRHFLADWVEATAAESHRDTPEQRSLARTVERRRESFISKDPGPAWVMFDDCANLNPTVKPIVVHRQCSRVYRHCEASK